MSRRANRRRRKKPGATKRSKSGDQKRGIHLGIEQLESRLLLTHAPFDGDILDTGPYSLPSGAGYLAFTPTTVSPGNTQLGNEWTGWVDIRHPSLDGTTDLMFGYERSDHSVTTNPLIVTDGKSEVLPPATAAALIKRDYEFANKIYAQAGISISPDGPAVAITSNGVTFPLDDDGILEQMKGPGRAKDHTGVDDPTVINTFYVTSLERVSNGVSVRPGTSTSTNDGIILPKRSKNSTFAHELAHLLLEESDAGHSKKVDNFFYKSGTNYDFDSIDFTSGIITPTQIHQLDQEPSKKDLIDFDKGAAGYGHRVDWDFCRR